MTSQHDKSKRWRPKFSVRTLAIVMTLMCCYAACWSATKRQGVTDVYRFAANQLHEQGRSFALDFQNFMPEHLNASATMPFIVGLDSFRTQKLRRYYFWFFGYVARLPFEREISVSLQD